MNTTRNLLLSLQLRGAKILIEGDKLRYWCPKGAIPPAEIQDLRAHRLEIMKLLQTTQPVATVPLEPPIGSAPIPLTASQRMPWYFAEKPHSRTMPFAFRISGALDFALLQRSLDFLMRRHDSLRTRILVGDHPPSLQTTMARDYHRELIDITGASARVSEQLAHPLIQEFVDQKVDPSIDPLFDTRVFRLADDDHILVISIDHVISDAITNQILSEELLTLYKQAVTRRPVSLPPVSLQFPDYALQLEKMYPFWRETHGPYWERRLRAAPSMRFPVDRDTGPKRSPGFASVTVPIGAQLTAELVEFSRRERTPLALVVLSVCVVVISRWCNQTDFIVGLVDSGRHCARLARMVGLLASHLHLRFELKANQTYLDLLEMVKQELHSASYHRDFDWVPSLIPEFKTEILFNWLSSTSNSGAFVNESNEPLPKIRIKDFPVELSESATFDYVPVLPFKLALWCRHIGDELTAGLAYRADLFAAQTIEGVGRNMRICLEETIRQPLLSCV